MSQPQVLTLKQLLVVGAALFVAQMCFGGFVAFCLCPFQSENFILVVPKGQ
jgi:hypothetical protein